MIDQTARDLYYACVRSPREDTPRLMLADRIEETGRPDLADWLRGHASAASPYVWTSVVPYDLRQMWSTWVNGGWRGLLGLTWVRGLPGRIRASFPWLRKNLPRLVRAAPIVYAAPDRFRLAHITFGERKGAIGWHIADMPQDVRRFFADTGGYVWYASRDEACDAMSEAILSAWGRGTGE